MKKMVFAIIFVIVSVFIFISCGQNGPTELGSEILNPIGLGNNNDQGEDEGNGKKPPIDVPPTDEPPEENDNDWDNTGTFWRVNFGGALEGLPFDRYSQDNGSASNSFPLKIVITDTAMLHDFFADTYSLSLNGAVPVQNWVRDERFSDLIAKYDDKFFESRQLVTFLLGSAFLSGENLNVGRNGTEFKLGETVYTDGTLNINIDDTSTGGYTAISIWFAIIETNIVSPDTAIYVNIDRGGRIYTF